MSNSSHEQTSYTYRIFNYIKSHQLSLSLFLAAFGALYLSSVILNGWSLTNWGKDIISYPPSTINTLMPRGFINPIFFITSFPSLMIGTMLLCAYTIRGIRLGVVDNKRYVAILLTACGFTYQVIGVWPLWDKTILYTWTWQAEIAGQGSILVWVLYILSLSVLIIGSVSLYVHSKIFHENHPELYREKDFT